MPFKFKVIHTTNQQIISQHYHLKNAKAKKQKLIDKENLVAENLRIILLSQRINQGKYVKANNYRF